MQANASCLGATAVPHAWVVFWGHESRDTKHESRLSRLSLATVHWPLTTAFEVFTNHESRNTNHGFFRVLRPSGGEKCRLTQAALEQRPHHMPGFCFGVTNHETRDTNHGF